MSLGHEGSSPGGSGEEAHGVGAGDRVEWARAIERQLLRDRLRATIVPGLEELVDPGARPSDLIALADKQARRLRAELESQADHDSHDLLGVERDAPVLRAREAEREWLRGHLHDTALQILEFIAGDGFDTGLSAAKIARLAGGAARDLHRFIDRADEMATTQLLPELERITAEARTLDSRIELVVAGVQSPPTGEQASALAGAVREAVTNARKHANASHVVVRVETRDDGSTAITVTDDGVGIDPDRDTDQDGLGVQGSIVGRMERIGGQASLQCEPGGGTRVTLVTTTSTQETQET
jgi:anti-sigma regulatory factor (Ser/Thr protein kinase)